MNNTMNTTTPAIIESASLHFCEGASDKVYLAAIEARDDGHSVTFAYGRRGATLTTGTKNPLPVPLDQARRIFGQLVKSKLAKGYRPTGTTTGTMRPYQQSGDGRRDTGIRPQLLNPVGQDEVGRLIASNRFCLQQWSGATWTGA